MQLITYGENKMKISTEIGTLSIRLGEHKAVELVGKAGFDCWDFTVTALCRYNMAKNQINDIEHPLRSKDYLKFVRELRKIGEDYGMTCNQSHAPLPSHPKEVRSYFKRALECTAVAGGKVCVIHPAYDWSDQKNAEMYMELLPFAKACGVKIATENMYNSISEHEVIFGAACCDHKRFPNLVNLVNDDYFVGCVDIGHAELKDLETSAVKIIKALGNKCQALHVHDNDSIHDQHALPFTEKVDFYAIMRALKEINYQGELTMEAISFLYNKENSTLEGVKKLYSVAKQLADYFDSL